MSTASFLTFATLLVLMTLSWSQPGKAAPNPDDGHPKRAASQIIRTEKMFQSTVWALCLIWMTNAIGAHAGGKTPPKTHPCDIKNGGCSQICGRVGNKAICSCKGDYWLKNDKKSCKKLANLTDYVMVTSEDGTAYASSELSTTYKADKAFGEDGYWCSIWRPDTPVRLWFQFKEPKRVVQIKFEEQYEMSGEDGYEVFGSDAVGDCGGPNNQNVLTEAAASEFVTGKEFQNDQFFYCYGIQTNSYGRRDYVSAKKLKFGFEEKKGCGFKKFDDAECDEQTDRNWGCEDYCWRSDTEKSSNRCYPTYRYRRGDGIFTKDVKRFSCWSEPVETCLEIATHDIGDFITMLGLGGYKIVGCI